MTASQPATNLFRPIKVGKINLNQRITLAPLTRTRADNAGQVPNDIIAEYYEQRASVPGTLLISEGTFISGRAGGYPDVPGIWSKEQIAGWKKVTDRVHKKGSFIYLQLWALGRSAGAEYLKGKGYPYVSASDIPDLTNSGRTFTKVQKAGNPRPLTVEEIQEYVQDYAKAAKNAIEAGFDGVEIHGANGYLIDQFMRECTNVRTDSYGGSIENRARFALQIVDAVTAAVGADRVGIRISPFETFGGMTVGPDAIPQFSYFIEALEKRGLSGPDKRLAYLHVVDTIVEKPGFDGKLVSIRPMDFARFIWSGVWIRTSNYNRQTAIETADNDDSVIIGFGKDFLANPDLVRRLKEDLPLNSIDFNTLYTPGPKGYVDYPFFETK